MTENKSILLRNMARSSGLCDEWFKQWRDDLSDDDLLNLYVRGIDFSIDKEWIANDVAKNLFDKQTLNKHGIYIDDDEVSGMNFPNVILNGNCNGNISYDKFSVGNIYVRHDSKIKITVSDFARCFIETYDNSSTEVVNYSNNKVFVYHHGGAIVTTGNVVVREK